MDREDDGNQWFLSNLMSHSDIYRLLYIYPFVKYYGRLGSFALRFLYPGTRLLGN